MNWKRLLVLFSFFVVLLIPLCFADDIYCNPGCGCSDNHDTCELHICNNNGVAEEICRDNNPAGSCPRGDFGSNNGHATAICEDTRTTCNSKQFASTTSITVAIFSIKIGICTDACSVQKNECKTYDGNHGCDSNKLDGTPCSGGYCFSGICNKTLSITNAQNALCKSPNSFESSIANESEGTTPPFTACCGDITQQPGTIYQEGFESSENINFKDSSSAIVGRSLNSNWTFGVYGFLQTGSFSSGVDTSTNHSGSSSLKLVLNKSDADIHTNGVHLDAGNYYFTVWVKANLTIDADTCDSSTISYCPRVARVLLISNGADGSIFFNKTLPLNGTYDWAQFNASFSTPTPTDLAIYLGSNWGKSTGTIWFDDLTLTRKSKSDLGEIEPSTSSNSLPNEWLCNNLNTLWNWSDAMQNIFNITPIDDSYDVISNGAQWHSCNPNNISGIPNSIFNYSYLPEGSLECPKKFGVYCGIVTGNPNNWGNINNGYASNTNAGNTAQSTPINTFLSGAQTSSLPSTIVSNSQGQTITITPEVNNGNKGDTFEISGSGFSQYCSKTNVTNAIINANSTKIIDKNRNTYSLIHNNIEIGYYAGNFIMDVILNESIDVDSINDIGFIFNCSSSLLPLRFDNAFIVNKSAQVISISSQSGQNASRFICSDEGGYGSFTECCGNDLRYCFNDKSNTYKTKRSGEPLSTIQEYRCSNNENCVLQLGFIYDSQSPFYTYSLPTNQTNLTSAIPISIKDWSSYDNLEFDIYLTISNVLDIDILDNSLNNILLEEQVINYSTTGNELGKWHHIIIPLSLLQNKSNIGGMMLFANQTELKDSTNHKYIIINNTNYANVIGLDRIFLSRDEQRFCAANQSWISDLDQDKTACNNVASYLWTSSDVTNTVHANDVLNSTYCCGAKPPQQNTDDLYDVTFNQEILSKYNNVTDISTNTYCNNSNISYNTTFNYTYSSIFTKKTIHSNFATSFKCSYGCNQTSGRCIDFNQSYVDSLAGCWKSLPMRTDSVTENNSIMFYIKNTSMLGEFYTCFNQSLNVTIRGSLLKNPAQVDNINTTCQNLGSWYCDSVDSKWHNATAEYPNVSIDSQRFVPNDTTYNPIFNLSLPSASRCCPESYCNNGTTCINSVIYTQNTDQPPIFRNFSQSGYRCNASGMWNNVSLRHDYYYSNDTGYCSDDSSCYYNKTCYTHGQWLILNATDRMCWNGNWTTRTKYIAAALLDYTNRTSVTNYVLYCDSLNNSLDLQADLSTINYQINDSTYFSSYVKNNSNVLCTAKNCVNDFCILRNLDNENIIIGTSLNIAKNITINSTGYQIYKIFGFADGDILNNVNIGNGNITKIAYTPLSGKLYYVQDKQIIFYTDNEGITDLSQTTPTPWDNFINFLTAPFKAIAGFFTKASTNLIPADVIENKTQDFNKLYLAHILASPIDKSIIGFVETKYFNETQDLTSKRTFMTINYTGFDAAKICNATNVMNLKNCTATANNAYVFDSNESENHYNNIWQDLTSKLRLK